MEVMREVMLVMTGGLGVAGNGNEKMYHYIKMHVLEHYMYIYSISAKLSVIYQLQEYLEEQ